MSKYDQHLLQAILRDDFTSFIQRAFQTIEPGRTFMPNWHIEAMAWHLRQCFEGNIKRLIITVPPRNLKSICASVAFPAWALGRDPTKKIICVSYSEDFAIMNARNFRKVMESDSYHKIFPMTRADRKKDTEKEFTTTQGGSRFTTSVSGGLTGRGGNIIILDDLLKSSDGELSSPSESLVEWLKGTLYTRLDDKSRDVIILVMQRLQVDDLAGYLLDQGGWVHLNLPAIAETPDRIQIGESEFHNRAVGDVLHPEREPLEVLDGLKKSMGTYNFSAQYQQNPLPPEGNIIKWEWFRRYQARPDKCCGDQMVQSWDTASKPGDSNSYSVCTTWLVKGPDFYLLDVLREQLNYPALKKRVVEHAQKIQGGSVLIENMSSGAHLIPDLCEEGILYPIEITPVGDKETRMRAQSAKIEAGHLFLPEEAPWLADFEEEVKAFPRGRYDDQVDSMSQFLGWVCPFEPSKLTFPDDLFRSPGLSYYIDGRLIPIPMGPHDRRFRFF